MDNRKKNIHNSGPLGMLITSGQIKPIDNDEPSKILQTNQNLSPGEIGRRRFETQSGIEFHEDELMYIDPKICEPWKYANRLEGNMGNIEELVASIRENKQLQPALIRAHPNPHDKIQYEIIFGRRRHMACMQLNVPFLVIKKNINTVQEALIFQEAENRIRKDISNYSNAILYKRLLEDNVFKNEKEISENLVISLSGVYDILSYSKIPETIIQRIPNIHTLSNSLALKIVSLLKKYPEKQEKMAIIASEIGKTINSPKTLEMKLLGDKEKYFIEKSKVYTSNSGIKLFTLKMNHRGALCLEVNKSIQPFIDYEKLCQNLKFYLEEQHLGDTLVTR